MGSDLPEACAPMELNGASYDGKAAELRAARGLEIMHKPNNKATHFGDLAESFRPRVSSTMVRYCGSKSEPKMQFISKFN